MVEQKYTSKQKSQLRTVMIVNKHRIKIAAVKERDSTLSLLVGVKSGNNINTMTLM